MQNTAPVVVGADGSPTAREALRWAAYEAARVGRSLRIVHAVEPWIYSIPFHPAPGVMETIEDTGRAILGEAAKEVTGWLPELPVQTVLVFDPPAVALRRQADDAHEIVVGNRGLGGFSGLLLGSVGLHTAGYANGVVIVVRGESRAERGEVLVGVDLSEHAGAALEYAFGAAAVRGARLRIVHAWLPPDSPYTMVDIDYLAESEKKQLHELVTAWHDRHPEVEIEATMTPSHPVKTLAEHSKTADLVVVAARGHSGMRLGSVSHGLIHHADCPVAVIRPRE